MSRGEKLYQMMMAGTEAHARWDYETSMNILNDQKRPLIIGLIMILAVIADWAFAADLPATIVGSDAYQPAFYHLAVVMVNAVSHLCSSLISG